MSDSHFLLLESYYYNLKDLILRIVVILNENVAELVGAIIGDGYIYRNKRKYQIGFVGHQVTDKYYFEYLRELIKKEWNKEAKPVMRERAIRMTINSKEVVNFLINELSIPYGKMKSKNVVIPEQIRNNWRLAKHTIRGITDTDGSVFAVRKPRVERYPSIEITTISKNLAEQIKKILEERGFRVAKIWQFKSKLSNNLGYRFGLNGRENLKKWTEEIGFSNPYKLQRAKEYLN